MSQAQAIGLMFALLGILCLLCQILWRELLDTLADMAARFNHCFGHDTSIFPDHEALRAEGLEEEHPSGQP